MIEAIAWAFRQDIKPSSIKFVLVALGNFANDEGEAYPSIESICQRTSQDRKTVILALNQLVSNGLIRDTGRRKGSTQRVKVYQFTVPKAELLNGSKFPSKQSRISAETVPNFPINSSENGTQIHQGTVSGNHKEEPPPTVPQGGLASAEFVITEEAEAKRWICKLILKGKDPNRPWSYETQSSLVRQLPIPMREIQLVGRFHAIPPDDNVLELRTRRQSEGTLMPNWSDEVTKAEAFLKKIGAGSLNGTTPKKEPPLWREFFRWKYQPNCVLPPAFGGLDTHLKGEWAREHESFDKSPEWWHPTAREIFPNSDNLPASILDMPPTSRAQVLKKLSLTNAA